MKDTHILSMKVNMTQNYGHVIQPLLQPQQTTANAHSLSPPSSLAASRGWDRRSLQLQRVMSVVS